MQLTEAKRLAPLVYKADVNAYVCQAMYDAGDVVYFPQYYHEATDELVGVMFSRGKSLPGGRTYGVYFFSRKKLEGMTPKANFRPIAQGRLFEKLWNGEYD